MAKFYINDENKVYVFSNKKQDLIYLGKLIGETAEQLYWYSPRVNFVEGIYDKRFKTVEYSILYPQMYWEFKKFLSRYKKPFESVLRPIEEYQKAS